jgi:hypothetical protein
MFWKTRAVLRSSKSQVSEVLPASEPANAASGRETGETVTDTDREQVHENMQRRSDDCQGVVEHKRQRRETAADDVSISLEAHPLAPARYTVWLIKVLSICWPSFGQEQLR